MRHRTCLALTSAVGHEAGAPERQVWGDLPQLRGASPPWVPPPTLGGLLLPPPCQEWPPRSPRPHPRSVCPVLSGPGGADEQLGAGAELPAADRERGEPGQPAALLEHVQQVWARGSGPEPLSTAPPTPGCRHTVPRMQRSRVSLREESLLAQGHPREGQREQDFIPPPPQAWPAGAMRMWGHPDPHT